MYKQQAIRYLRYELTLSLVSLGYLLPMGHHRPLSNLQEDVIEAQDFGILFQSAAFDNPSSVMHDHYELDF